MTKADELNALADRCEREEASFELERAIAHAVGFYRPHPDLIRPKIETPKYTTSLDAAVTLIADGVEWDATTLYGVARVAVGLNLNEGPHYASHNDGLLPMAICAAALRARAALSHPEPAPMRSDEQAPASPSHPSRSA